MRRCWTEEEFSHHGRHFQFENVRCTPKPVQRPIPIWMGAFQGEAIQRAARLGDGLQGGGPSRRQYVEALASYGKDASDPHIVSSPCAGFMFCSEDPARDWEIIKPHVLYSVQNYARWFKSAGMPVFGDPPADADELQARGLCLWTRAMQPGRPQRRLRPCPLPSSLGEHAIKRRNARMAHLPRGDTPGLPYLRQARLTIPSGRSGTPTGVQGLSRSDRYQRYPQGGGRGSGRFCGHGIGCAAFAVRRA